MTRVRAYFVLTALIATACGACSLWRVFEQDIFWQIRAGDDLLRTHTFAHVDTWSYSVAGEPWINIQWVSTLLFRLIYACGGDDALVIARGMFVTAFFTVLGVACAWGPRQGEHEVPQGLRCAAVAVFLPLAYLATSTRLQLRSDMLVFIVAALLALLWSSRVSLPQQRWGTLGLIVLAANVHAGTAPFVVLQGGAYMLSACENRRMRVTWLIGAIAAFFVTPYHVTALPLLWAHLDYAHHNMLPNPDHVPFGAAALRTREGLLVGMGWLTLCGASIVALTRSAFRASSLPPAYRNLPITVVTWFLLAALSIDRARAIPYHVIYVLPLITSSLPLWRMSRAAYIAAGTASAACALLCGSGTRERLGFGVDQSLFPVGSARFIAEHRPRGNLLHTFAYGAYTVWYLRDYPTYVDTRESPFWRLQPEILAAYHSPEETQTVARKYGVNTTLMPIPKTRYIANMGFEDVLARYLPAREWALVYFDRLSTVMVRRTSEDQALIQAHEYKVLRPNLPANLYPLRGPRSQARDALFVSELERCLRDEPTQAYCLVAKAVWWRVNDSAPSADAAVALLEEARRTVASGSTQFATLMVELEVAYRNAQRPQEADAISRILGPGMTLVQSDSQALNRQAVP